MYEVCEGNICVDHSCQFAFSRRRRWKNSLLAIGSTFSFQDPACKIRVFFYICLWMYVIDKHAGSNGDLQPTSTAPPPPMKPRVHAGAFTKNCTFGIPLAVPMTAFSVLSQHSMQIDIHDIPCIPPCVLAAVASLLARGFSRRAPGRMLNSPGPHAARGLDTPVLKWDGPSSGFLHNS